MKDCGVAVARPQGHSWASYDAVATMDTVTLIRSAVRGVLAVADAPPRSSGLAQPAVLAAHGSCALGPHLARPLWRIQNLQGVQ